MKTKIYLTILFFLILSISCEKENDKTDKLTVKNIDFTDCLDDSKKSTSSLSCVALQAIADNYLQIQHQKTMFCCGTEKVDINVEIRNDTIYIQEIDLGPFTYCYCWHDLEFEIGPLNNKKYTLHLIGCETSYDRDSILVDFQYSNDLDSTNCN